MRPLRRLGQAQRPQHGRSIEENWRSTRVLVPIGLLAIVVVIVVVSIAVWGGSDNDDVEDAEQRAERARAQEGEGIEPSPVPAGARVVEVYDFEVSPSDIQVASGETLAFVNDSPSQHIIVIHGQTESDELAAGAVFTWTAKDPGTCDLQCQVHPEMTGNVTIE